MRRLVALAVTTAVAAGGLAGPHIGLGSVPGISALHQVQRLLRCDARAIDTLGTASASAGQTAPAGCRTVAQSLVPGTIRP